MGSVFWYEPWIPKTGDLVSISLSGECVLRTPAWAPSATTQNTLHTHSDEDFIRQVHGMHGVVTNLTPPDYIQDQGHFYVVRFDSFVSFLGITLVGDAFNALELKKLST